MMDLQKEFKKETGKIALTRAGSVTSVNLHYIDWLESQLTQSRAREAELVGALGKQPQWIPAKDFGLFEIHEDGSWEGLVDEPFFGMIIQANGGIWLKECVLEDGSGLHQLNGEDYEPADYEIGDLDYCMKAKTEGEG